MRTTRDLRARLQPRRGGTSATRRGAHEAGEKGGKGVEARLFASTPWPPSFSRPRELRSASLKRSVGLLRYAIIGGFLHRSFASPPPPPPTSPQSYIQTTRRRVKVPQVVPNMPNKKVYNHKV